MKTIRILLAIVAISLYVTDLYADKDVALVLKVSGNAERKTATTDWTPLKRGTRLNGGDKIRTGNQTLVAVVFTDDKSLMKVRSRSEVTIYGKRTKIGIAKRIDMGLGQLWAKVTPGGAGFRIETPTGVAAVKGTEFYVTLGLDGLLEVFGVEGIVQLYSRLGSVNVGAGQKGVLPKGQSPQLLQAEKVPDWGPLTQDEKEITIEFLDDEGNKKYLKLKFQ